MTRLFWVRHGPTHEKVCLGQRDVPADLSDNARLARLAAHLPGDALVVSSDLIRASATAGAIAAARPRLPARRDLREFDFGAWDGLSFDAISDRDPVLSRQFWEDPGDLTAPDGESWNDVATRVGAAVDDLVAAHPGRDIVAVAHMGVIMTQIARAARCTPYQAMGHKIDPLSVTDMMLTPDGWRLGQINHHP